jgi:hypothetical protein
VDSTFSFGFSVFAFEIKKTTQQGFFTKTRKASRSRLLCLFFYFFSSFMCFSQKREKPYIARPRGLFLKWLIGTKSGLIGTKSGLIGTKSGLIGTKSGLIGTKSGLKGH